MAFSATDWRYRLSEWSGSSQGDRSWSALGKSTRIGGYFNYFYSYTYQINFVYRGDSYPSQTPQAERNVEPYTAYAYRVDYQYAAAYDNLCGYTYVFVNASYYNYYTFYVGQGAYTGLAQYKPAPVYTSFGGTTFFYSSVYNYGGYNGVSSWSPSTFYNYAPWGGGPYSAGSNISIGNGVYSGYPYQYIHN